MSFVSNQQLFDQLQELNVIPAALLTDTFKNAQEKGKFLGDLLFEQDLITDENLGKVISEISGVPVIRLTEVSIPKEILSIIPEVYAKKNQVIAFAKDKTGLKIALTDPSNQEVPQFIEKKVGLPVIVYCTTNHQLKESLNLYSQDVDAAFEEIISQNIAETKNKLTADLPVIRIVDTILSYAHQNKASDIHIEPKKEHSLVRFRIDGILHDIVNLPPEVHPHIVTRIKVLSRLRVDEHQATQDGKLQFNADGEQVDLRVSFVPTTLGEKIVMRLLSEKSRQFSLTSLGLGNDDYKKVESAYHKPYGMILATGPTGSGKTTTMYAVLKLLNNRGVNIMTIEDPVEYDIEGVNQIQVNPKTDLTFAQGLRSIVRQDPDIILVGEIRDNETADIAVNSAMTGHLVLSTLHTNDAATAIPRLFDLGVEPFLIASSVNCLIAQRLVRQICPKCRASQEITLAQIKEYQLPNTLIKKHFGAKSPYRVYHGKGCLVCHNTGYQGRVGIFETLVINEEIRQAIITRQDAGQILKLAIKSGMTTMLEDGLSKVAGGLTTLDEIIRVTKV